jgi:anti-anti-sigma regulatory factor
MDIATHEVQGRVTVTVLQPQGEVDGRTYKELIGRAQQAYGAGARQMVIDLGGVSFLSSSGLVAIHSIAKLLHGQELPDLEAGWSTLHKVGDEITAQQPKSPHVKLANPQPAVERVLQTTGFGRMFEIFADLETAVASF